MCDGAKCSRLESDYNQCYTLKLVSHYAFINNIKYFVYL